VRVKGGAPARAVAVVGKSFAVGVDRHGALPAPLHFLLDAAKEIERYGSVSLMEHGVI